MQANIYLFFNGNCEEAFTYYAKVMGAKIETMTSHRGTPAEQETVPEWRDKILYACLKIGNTAIMASDAPPGRQQDRAQGFSVSLGVDTPAEAERIFAALCDGAAAPTMAMAQTFFAARFGMVTDRFGVPWMIICEKPN